MHWILQEFEDTHKLATALDRLGIPYTKHKVVPFVGDLQPPPKIKDLNNVVMFGSYSLWKTAEKTATDPASSRSGPSCTRNLGSRSCSMVPTPTF